jgi:hypothetical protein
MGPSIPNRTGSGFFLRIKRGSRHQISQIGVCFAICFSFLMALSRLIKVLALPGPSPIATMGFTSRANRLGIFFAPKTRDVTLGRLPDT